MDRRLRVGLAIAAVLAIVVLGRVLPLATWAAGAAEQARGAGGFGIVSFNVLYALATVLLLPGSPLTVAAGAAWGPWWGLAAVWPGATIGALGAFLLGRTLLRRRAEAVIAEDRRWRALDHALAAQGGRLVFLLRLSPVFPFNLLNLGLGATPVAPWTYTWTTAVGILPGTLLYVMAGAALGDLGAVALGRAPERGVAGWLMMGVGLMATIAVTVALTRMARQAVNEALGNGVEEDLA